MLRSMQGKSIYRKIVLLLSGQNVFIIKLKIFYDSIKIALGNNDHDTNSIRKIF